MSSDVMALTSDKPQHEYELSLADLGLIKRLAWDESLPWVGCIKARYVLHVR
jgi:hypothetical protein